MFKNIFYLFRFRPSYFIYKKEKITFIGSSDISLKKDLFYSLADIYEISVIGSNVKDLKKLDNSIVKTFYYPLERSFSLINDIKATLKLIKLLKSINPIIIHTSDTKPSILGRISGLFIKTPILLTTFTGLGTLYSMLNPNLFIKITRKIYESVQKILCKYSSRVIFQNQDDFNSFKQKGIVGNDSLIIPGSGVNCDYYRKSNSLQNTSSINNIILDKSKIVITMISRLVRSKGILDYCKAAYLLKKKYENANFILIGPKDNFALDKFSNDDMEYITKNIIWLGHRKDIRNLLNLSDIFILPQQFREGFSRVLLEAAAMSLPIVTTNVPGCNEIVIDGENGFIINPGDIDALQLKISILINDPSLREEMGVKSRKLVKSKYDIAIISNHHKSLYRYLINNQSK